MRKASAGTDIGVWASGRMPGLLLYGCFAVPHIVQYLLQIRLVAVVPRSAFWPIPLEPQSENKVTAVSPASKWSLANDFEISHLPMALSSHANTQRRFHRITCSPTGLTILLSPPSSPMGLRMLAGTISSDLSANCGARRGIYITTDPQPSNRP